MAFDLYNGRSWDSIVIWKSQCSDFWEFDDFNTPFILDV